MKAIENGLIFVYTYKEGLLSAVAHDLELQLKDFSVQFNGGDVTATFTMSSLTVVGAMQDGQPQSSALSSKDKSKIEDTMRKQVLSTRKFGQSKLAARVTDGVLDGTLTLVGKTAPIKGEVHSHNGVARGVVELRPTNWGIKPYTALFGALRLQDRVRVEFQMDLPL